MGLKNAAERVIAGLVTLLLLSVVIFVCTQLLPRDAAVMMLGENATEEALARLRERLGLERPPHEQYLAWLAGIVSGDFGVSLTRNQPIGAILEPRFWNSLALTVLTLLVAAAIAIPLGVLAAVRRGRASDASILTISYIGISIPDFVLGPLLIVLLASPPLALFPSSGLVPLAQSPLGWLHHMALPVLALTAILTAHLMRQTRSGILDVLQSDYVRTARLKGMPERVVLWRHCLRNALTATIAILALDLGFLMGSIVIVEEVFAYPGLGRLIVSAVGDRDIPMIQASAFVIAAVYVGANIVADLVHAALNPRLSQR